MSFAEEFNALNDGNPVKPQSALEINLAKFWYLVGLSDSCEKLQKKLDLLEAKNKVLMKEMKRISEIYEEASSDIAKEAIKKCKEID